MVELGRVCRSGFYRFDESTDPGPDPDMDLRDAIQKDRVGVAELRPAAHHRGTAAARMEGESQTRLPADARGQPAVRAEAEVRRDHRFQSRPQGLSEPGAHDDADRHRSALGGRYHLHSAARRVRLPGRDSGRLLAPRDRLGAGSDDGRRVDAGSAADGAVAAQRAAGSGASFRPRLAVRQQRLHGLAERQRHRRSACRARAIRGTTRPANRS